MGKRGHPRASYYAKKKESQRTAYGGAGIGRHYIEDANSGNGAHAPDPSASG